MAKNWSVSMSVFYPAYVRARAAMALAFSMTANVITRWRVASQIAATFAVITGTLRAAWRGRSTVQSTLAVSSAEELVVIPAVLTPNLWLEWRFDEGSGYVVRNYARSGGTTPTVKNMLAASNGPYTGTNTGGGAYGGWVRSAITLTPDAATYNQYQGTYAFPDESAFFTDALGGNRGYRLQGSAGSSLVYYGSFPGGTKTLSIYMKSNTGVNQMVALGSGADNCTVTPTWQRFTFTITGTSLNSGIVIYCNTNIDILFCYPQLEAGSVATAYDAGYGHLVANASLPLTSSGLDMSTYQFFAKANSNFPANTPVTIYALIKWVPGIEPQNGQIAEVISDNWATFSLAARGGAMAFSDWRFGSLMGGAFTNWNPTFEMGGVPLLADNVHVQDGHWHLLAATADGSTLKFYFDGKEVATKSAAHSLKIPQLNIGGDVSVVPATYGYLAMYQAAHTASDVANNFLRFQSIANSRGISLPNFARRLVVSEGDSITWLSNSYVYVARTQLFNADNNVWLNDQAVNGSLTAGLLSRAPQIDALYYSYMRPVLTLMIGVNDITASPTPVPVSTVFANIKTYCQARRALGYKIICQTVLPSTRTGANAARATLNSMLRADSSFYDALIDWDTTVMGPDSAASDTSLYYDGTHPTDLGFSNLAAVYTPAVQAILALP